MSADGCDSSVELALAVAAEIGEGPTWDEVTGTLLWVDILAGLIHRFDPSRGTDVMARIGCPVGSLGLRRRGGIVLALAHGFALASSEALDAALPPPRPSARTRYNASLSGQARSDESRSAGKTGGFPPTLVTSPVEGFSVDTTQVRFNDGNVDPEGRFLAGTMHWFERSALGSLYLLEPSGAVREVITDVIVSNGLAVSNDLRSLYYVDSPTGGVDIFDRNPDTGALSRRRRLIEIPRREGSPDGLTLDAEGFLWVAIWGGGQVRRYSSGGRLDRTLRLPVSQVTSLVFGGPRYEDLFITTARVGLSNSALAEQPHAGDVFWAHPGMVGLPSALFAG
ncbi:MAG: SMP-30/gluconolactonase/LRE family protein [Acidimicrobiales bacterium]